MIISSHIILKSQHTPGVAHLRCIFQIFWSILQWLLIHFLAKFVFVIKYKLGEFCRLNNWSMNVNISSVLMTVFVRIKLLSERSIVIFGNYFKNIRMSRSYYICHCSATQAWHFHPYGYLTSSISWLFDWLSRKLKEVEDYDFNQRLNKKRKKRKRHCTWGWMEWWKWPVK